MKHTISKTLITAVVSITIAAMGMSFAISALNIEKLVTDLASEKLTNRLTNVSTQVESWYDALNVAFQELTNDLYRSRNKTLDEKADVIFDAFRAFPYGGYLNDLYAGFPDKGFACSTDYTPPADYDPTALDWYKLACEHPGETVITPAYIDDKVSESWRITVARTIHPKDGSLGVLAADYTHGSLNKLLSRINMGSTNLIILQNDGNLITHPDVYRHVNSYGIIESIETLDDGSYKEFYDTLKAEVGNTFRLSVKGVDNYYACRKIGNGWYVLAFESASAFRKPLYDAVVLLLIVSCTSIMGILVTMVIVTRRIVGKPLGKLTAAAREFSIDNTVSFAGVDINMNNELKILTETLKSMELRMRAAFNEAQAASRAKSDFLSRMSHEIRTPLNAIIGMIGIAMNTEDQGRIRHCLDRADNASKHLLGVINDILDMSKIEADKFELDSREFNFEKLLMNITNVTNFRAEEKNQNFIVNLNDNVPAYIVGDDLRLSQVITNLLTNAVKFTSEGGTVLLTIDKIEDTGDDVTLRFEVADSGIGISEEQQKRLFTSFEQADGSISRKFGGTGLGLAISKRIVELMGGKIWIESELGCGSKFIFTIRAAKGKAKAHTKLSEKINKDDMRILAVDDSPEIREYFTHVMTSLGLPCDVAANGFEALDMVKNCGAKPYNIFFVDWQMPEMDGIELTKRLKETAPDNSVVFMISVAEWSVIEKDALAAGVKSFISKPLFPSTLVNAINECVKIERQDAATGAKNQSKMGRRTFHSHTILIAEDVEINREIMSVVLENSGLSIDYAEDGLKAVSMFQNDPGRYSLILMDIQMPEMDGYGATRKIRALETAWAKDIPIIAMTANVFREDIENCLSAGMNDHIGKPIDQDDLFTKLGKYLR